MVESCGLGQRAKKVRISHLIEVNTNRMTNIKIYMTLLSGTIFLFLLLRIQGAKLINEQHAPMGIVSLELAPTPEKAKDLVHFWQQEGLMGKAYRNILWDYLFIPFYMLFFYSLCGSISVRLKGPGAKWGVLLAFGALMAGILDVLENCLMLLTLSKTPNTYITILTSIFASAKFLLLALCLLYVIPLGARLLLLKMKN